METCQNETALVHVLRRLIEAVDPFVSQASQAAVTLADIREEAIDLLRAGGCLIDSAPDEPVFTLCARDPDAGDLVRDWADRYERRKVRMAELDARAKDKVQNARLRAIQMDTWRLKRYAESAGS